MDNNAVLTQVAALLSNMADRISEKANSEKLEGSQAQSFQINNEKLRTIQNSTAPAPKNNSVIIDYYGHSCIKITTPQGIRIVIDPWRNDKAWGWWFCNEFPAVNTDIALSTHAHFDHDALHLPHALITMERMIGSYNLGDVKITGLADKHLSESLGKTRWTEIQQDTGECFAPPNNNLHMDNIIYVIEINEICIVHWGDNRAVPSDFVKNYLKNKKIDVLFIPIDESGHILSYNQANEIMDEYKPGITMPIHYYQKGLNTVLSTLQPCNPWVDLHDNPIYLDSSRLIVKPDMYPQNGKQIITFGPHFTLEK